MSGDMYAENLSLWMATAPAPPPRPALSGTVRGDVVVIGGGLVGITTALMLREAGRDVVLIEAGRLAAGVSGYTTAKVSSQHGFIYERLRSNFGTQTARDYGAANEDALSWIAQRIDERAIACDFRRRSSFAYVTSEKRRDKAEREAAAAREAGLLATLVDDTPLPFAVAGAVRFDHQAELHPRRYLLALVEQFEAAGGRTFEGTPALKVDAVGRRVTVPAGQLLADHVVVATHYPILDRSLAFARVHPERSYLIACRVDGELPDGMHISAEGPTRSVRAAPSHGHELLLIGGDSHKTGHGGDTEARYANLEAFARRHWDVTDVVYRWSAQDGITVDGRPYAGRVVPWSGRLLAATGFAKWGFTGGTAAAKVMTDLVLGDESPWQSLFDPARVTLRASARRLVAENAAAACAFAGDRLRSADRGTAAELAPGTAGIVEHDGKRVAAHRDEDGRLLCVSPRCTHMGCWVRWNRAERSWDCPCHGSRFAPDGAVLEGPAVRPLTRVESEQQEG